MNNIIYKNTQDFILHNSVDNNYLIFILDDIDDMNKSLTEIQKIINKKNGISYNEVCSIINKNVKCNRYETNGIERK